MSPVAAAAAASRPLNTAVTDSYTSTTQRMLYFIGVWCLVIAFWPVYLIILAGIVYCIAACFIGIIVPCLERRALARTDKQREDHWLEHGTAPEPDRVERYP